MRASVKAGLVQPKTSGFNSSKGLWAVTEHEKALLISRERERRSQVSFSECRLISDKTRRARMRDGVRHAARKYQIIRHTLSVEGAAKLSYMQVNILPLERWKGADLIAAAS